ncbi:MAG: NAD(P)H-hydrate dehydratase [Verrucomicrobia bacterium]|jgi:NAD(P)H-hydrate epimerase|nr:NAD(P)H-hydrate dehydratase [Verrucomicrobiota bacterium]
MPIPVISVAQMREWEKANWAAGLTEAGVIRRVGKVLAPRALQLTQPGSLILILAGKGHNGDDARAAREHLSDRQVELLDVTAPEMDLPKLAAALVRRPALVVDGLFGIGLNRPLDEPWVKFITRVNQARLPVLAVDVPSGLDADTGATFGAAIEASVTLTIGAPKQGLLCPAAWPFVGRLEVASEVGLIPCPLRGELSWTLAEDFTGFPPARPVAGHKGSFGHLGMLAGSVGYHGAAVLAARAAQRAQPGLSTLFTHEPAYHAIASQLQAVMVKPWDATVKVPDDFSALLIGPGLAAADLPDEMKLVTRKLWRDLRQPVIVDATALDWLPLGPVPRKAIRVLTPHPGEAARLRLSTPQQVQADRPHALREISKRYNDCWVVLKGHQTLIGRSAGEIFVNPSGNPHLAQGGSGDVLAGFIAGLLAQPALQADAGQTLRYAVWQHGAAADMLQARRTNWIIEDLLPEIGQARP